MYQFSISHLGHRPATYMSAASVGNSCNRCTLAALYFLLCFVFHLKYNQYAPPATATTISKFLMPYSSSVSMKVCERRILLSTAAIPL
jgi:hypothetical protein